MSYKTLLVEAGDNGVVVVTFNRPDVRNALGQEMVDELHACLKALSADPSVRALLFTGAGDKAFISGANIAELRERGRRDAMAMINNGLFREIERFPHPTLACIRGWALGGGCEIALACDLRIAGESAKLGQPEVGLGILPGAGATYRLPKVVGTAMARELIFTGRIIDAREALRIGLVNRVVADDAVMATGHELAAEIVKNSGWAVRYAKMALRVTGEMSTEAAMAFEATSQAVLFEDDEKMARMTAFLEKKKS